MEENQSLLELEVDQETGTNILEMAKWAKLYGILVSTIFGLCLLLFFIGWRAAIGLFDPMSEMDNSNAATGAMMIITGFLIIIAAVVIIMLVYLFKGISGLKTGIQTKDQLTFNMGLANLRNAFAIYAIVGIIMLLFQLIRLF